MSLENEKLDPLVWRKSLKKGDKFAVGRAMDIHPPVICEVVRTTRTQIVAVSEHNNNYEQKFSIETGLQLPKGHGSWGRPSMEPVTQRVIDKRDTYEIKSLLAKLSERKSDVTIVQLRAMALAYETHKNKGA